MAEGGASKAPAPWFRLFADDWTSMTRDLSAAEAGILINLLVHMHKHGEPVGNDHARLARRCGTTKVAFSRTVETLLKGGQLIKTDAGLWSAYMANEIEHRGKISLVRSKSAKSHREKSEQYQRGENAYVPQSSESREGEDDDLFDRHRSSTSNSTLDHDPRSTIEGMGDDRASHSSPSFSDTRPFAPIPDDYDIDAPFREEKAHFAPLDDEDDDDHVPF